jgi:Rps23 Pro-64 3,4-dihydroxylase Tpa1-like proline 4-hydroxylase
MTLQLAMPKLPPGLLQQARGQWPASDWAGWFRYDSDDERKSVCPDWKLMPEPCRRLLGLMATLPPEPGVIPDLSLYGGGMHSMVAGDRLHLHLDADTHKLSGLRRRYSSVLFLTSEWLPEWGGECWPRFPRKPDYSARSSAPTRRFTRYRQ